MARPKVAIDVDAFKKLCGLQCTLEEIASFFDCSEDTVERWCKRENGISFADAYKKYSAVGKCSIRRMQFRLAEKSTAMAIFLGKQYLGQADVAVAVAEEPEQISPSAGLIAALEGVAAEVCNAEEG